MLYSDMFYLIDKDGYFIDHDGGCTGKLTKAMFWSKLADAQESKEDGEKVMKIRLYYEMQGEA